MKRYLTVLLAGFIIPGLLGGCGSKTETDNITENTLKDESDSVSDIDGWDGEVSHIVMTYLTMGITPADIDEVLAAVNEVTIPAIGVEVEFKVISAYDTFSQYTLWIGSGEQIDLMSLEYQDIISYASQGLINPIDDLLEANAPYILDCITQGYPLTDASYIDGEAYGITCVKSMYGHSGGYFILKEYVDAAGLSYDEDTIYSLDDLTDLFAAVKEIYPDLYPAGQITKGITTTTFGYYNGIYDPLGSDTTSGVIMGTDSTKVVNLYATDEYYDYLKHVREWYLKGYMYPDSATTDTSRLELTRSKVIGGYALTSRPGMKEALEGEAGGELVCLTTSEVHCASQTSLAGFWTVPITCADPDAAMRLLNMMYEDHDLTNLIRFGIEGKHYVMVDKEQNLIAFPDGMNEDTSGYYNTIPPGGDFRYTYTWSIDNAQDYTAKAMSNTTAGYGFAYSNADKTTQITAVREVLSLYLPALESGSVDLDIYYPEFIDALENAGINDVIADKQAHFDAWLAEQ